MIAYKRQKCQNKNKAKKGRNLKSQKRTWAGFCKISFSQSPSKKTNGHQTFRHKKDIRQARNSKPAINLQKWITKTAKKLTKRQNKTSSAAKSAASYLQKS